LPFKFDKAVLTADTKQDLDKPRADIQANKRFFIAVEGYTDTTGSKAYNESLSRKRADAGLGISRSQARYSDLPEIHMIGLGVDKPVDVRAYPDRSR